jgi:LuxR family maltose regulon positive regulatory protein
MTARPAAAGSGRAPGGPEPGLIRRRDLVAALDRAARKRVTIISAPAGAGKTSLLRAWADRPGRACPTAFVTVRPGQHDLQLFWLTVLGAVRAATGTGEGGAELPPAVPGSDGSVLVDRVLSELEESRDGLVLVIDDLHELSSPDAAGQLTALLTRLPAGVRAVVATRRDLSLRLHKLRLAGDLAEIRAAHLRFTDAHDRQGRAQRPPRSSRNTPACWAGPTSRSSPGPRRSRSCSRSASTTAPAARSIPDRNADDGVIRSP